MKHKHIKLIVKLAFIALIVLIVVAVVQGIHLTLSLNSDPSSGFPPYWGFVITVLRFIVPIVVLLIVYNLLKKMSESGKAGGIIEDNPEVEAESEKRTSAWESEVEKAGEKLPERMVVNESEEDENNLG